MRTKWYWVLITFAGLTGIPAYRKPQAFSFFWTCENTCRVSSYGGKRLSGIPEDRALFEVFILRNIALTDEKFINNPNFQP